jgi:hypothetical protein
MRIPLALMLSADPVPNQLIALDAPTVPRASGSIRFLHITSWSPSTSPAACCCSAAIFPDLG